MKAVVGYQTAKWRPLGNRFSLMACFNYLLLTYNLVLVPLALLPVIDLITLFCCVKLCHCL